MPWIAQNFCPWKPSDESAPLTSQTAIIEEEKLIMAKTPTVTSKPNNGKTFTPPPPLSRAVREITQSTADRLNSITYHHDHRFLSTCWQKWINCSSVSSIHHLHSCPKIKHTSFQDAAAAADVVQALHSFSFVCNGIDFVVEVDLASGFAFQTQIDSEKGWGSEHLPLLGIQAGP